MRTPLAALFSSLAVASLASACGSSQPQPASPMPVNPPIQAMRPPEPPPGPKQVATTLDAVGLDGSALDKSTDACTDFYQFACGGWIAKTQIPADRPRWNRSFAEIGQRNELELKSILEEAAKKSDPLSKKIGTYYAACMDEAAIEKAGTKPIEPLRKKAKAVRNAKDVAKVVIELHKERIWPLFDVSDEQDYKDATKVNATLDQAGLGLPDRDYYVKDDEKSKDIRAKYVAHVERMMTLAGYKGKEAKKAADDVMSVETALAKVSKTRVERRDPKGLYNKLDREGIAKVAPDFPWDAYFKGLGFEGIKDVNVTAPKFFEGMDALLEDTKPEVWRHYLDWTIVRSTADALPKAFVDEQFAMTKVLTGQEKQRDRWKRCVESTDHALGELVAQPFIERKFGGDSKQRVEEMVFAIRDAFDQNVGKLDWMGDKTKDRAKSKLKAMAYLIGYPVKWRQYDFDVDPNAYAADVLAARAFELKRRLSKVGKPVDRDEWDMTPPTVNAYYDPQKNHMVFPAGILQPPFYDPKANVAVNLGAMGMVVGHELTHGFDDEGSQFAGNGNLENWWEPEVSQKFQAKTGCVADQYGGYETIPGVKLNGKLTLGENIADIGGVKLAYAAFKKLREGAKEVQVADGFTEDQQFFLSVGQAWCSKIRDEYARMAAQVDPHSPPKYRVNGSLSDTPEFAAAFHCAKGTAMNPKNVCEVW